MNVTIETVATREVVLTVEPDAETVRRELRKAARQVSRQRPVAGFRPGRAPYDLVERMVGRELLVSQALSNVGQDLYREAIEEAGVEPFAQGELDVESEDPLVLKMRLPLVPVVQLGDYQSLHIEPEPPVSVTVEQIEAEIERLRRAHAEYEPVERPVALGDQVVATLKGVSGDEVLIDQSDSTIDVTDELIPPGFSEALIGMAIGETREFSLAYPSDFGNEELAGRTVDFAVSVDTIRQTHLPEVDDDLAKTASDYETLVELKEALATRIQNWLERVAAARESAAAIEAISAIAEVEYPAIALTREIDGSLDEQKARIQRSGFTFEGYLQMSGRTEQELREEIQPQAERSLVTRLILAELAKAENLAVDDSDIAAQVQSLSANVSAAYGERAPEVMQRLGQPGVVNSLYGNALLSRASRHLTDLLTGRVTTPDEAEISDTEADGEEGEPNDQPQVEASMTAPPDEVDPIGKVGITKVPGAEEQHASAEERGPSDLEPEAQASLDESDT